MSSGSTRTSNRSRQLAAPWPACEPRGIDHEVVQNIAPRAYLDGWRPRMTARSIVERLRLLARVVRSREITVGGVRYRVPRWWQADDAAGREPWLDDVLRAAFRCGQGSLVDVGANVGQSLLKLLAIDRSRQYVG